MNIERLIRAKSNVNLTVGRLQGLQEGYGVTELQKFALKKCEQNLRDAVIDLNAIELKMFEREELSKSNGGNENA